MPPAVVVALFLVIWEVACRKAGATLPPPSRVVNDAWELIAHPFYDHGGLDKGLFWHLLASLQRIAMGYTLAAIAGVALGTLVGQSVWAMRGLDPIFQVLRTVPPLAWLPLSLAAFRDGQPSAIFVIFITAIWPIIINTAVGIRNIPQDYRNVAAVLRLNPLEFFVKIMVPAAAPYIFTGLRIGIGHPRSLGLQQAVADFVLHRPRKEEQNLINDAIDKSLSAIPLLCEGKFEAAMMQLHTSK